MDAPRPAAASPARPAADAFGRRLRRGWRAAALFVAAALFGPWLPAGADPAPVTAVPAADPATTSALARARDAVVGVQVTAVEDARSIATLGRQRQGSGVVIDADGLVLTIGYLILEADDVTLVLDDGRTLPARVRAYDVATGLGLVQSLVPLALEPVPLGSAAALAADEPLLVVSGGDGGALGVASLVSRRAFAGYWEYLIDGAVFTAPARRDHGGAGLFNRYGELVGVGSLIVADAGGSGDTGAARPGNMFVPVDLLRPILAELQRDGRSAASRRAWIGLNAVEHEGRLRVLRVTPDSPAEAAGLRPGDRIVAIDGTAVDALAPLWTALWRGAAEREVRVEIERAGASRTLTVLSVDRAQSLRRPKGI